MKLADVKVFFTPHGIYLAQVNSRGNLKAGAVNITQDIFDALVGAYENKPDMCTIYNRDGDAFKITIDKLTEKQKADRARNKELDHAKAMKVLAMGAAFFDPGLRRRKQFEEMFGPVKRKEGLKLPGDEDEEEV